MNSAVEVEPELRRSKIGEPTWEIADLYPPQGHWSEWEYLQLETNKLIEFNRGVLEFLPMPNIFHQVMLKLLIRAFEEFIGNKGLVLFAPLRIKVADEKYREPDILLLLNQRDLRMGVNFWTGADLVVEIVSRGGEERDTVEKRADYAAAQIPEYWIVDPATEKILVLTLKGERYVEHGEFVKGQRATSVLLSGFEVEVSKVFSAGPQHLKQGT